MSRKHVVAVAGALVAVLAVLLFLRRHHDDAPAKPAAKPAAEDPWAKTAKPAEPTSKDAPKGRAPQWSFDIDPEGPLRLEGQVVDGDGKPVGGADVRLGSNPPRTTKTEDDGSFAFDKVVARTYSITAAHDQQIGDLEYTLSEKSDPAVVHLEAGAKLVVTVTDDKDKPIANADVKFAAAGERTAHTGPDGTATVAPVHPGWVGVEVTAAGHAPNSGFTTIGSANATGRLTIKLHPGVSVAGHVVDESGKPVANAHVAIAGPWDMDTDDKIITDAKGQFTIPAVSAGSHTLVAHDGDHAPARSSPVTVATQPVTGVEITMKAGGVVAGRVVDAEGKPVPYATVKVSGKGNNMWNVAARQAVADKAGTFEIKGLTRAKLQVRGESEGAASKLVDVDLNERPASREMKLVLDVVGTISGVVVNDKNEPVPEVQVHAFPDFLSGEASEGIAGMSSATTDGAGGFTLRGLPDGAYRLWAGRTSGGMRAWGTQGTAAKTGDKKVRIVLASPGTLVGSVAIDGANAPPKIAMISVGNQPATPADGGVFKLEDVSPGSYDVRIRGPEFAEYIAKDVKIEGGKTTDLGKITVNRGRKLTGKVVDASGAPVAGAHVKTGDMLFSIQGMEDQMGNIEESSGMRVATTDQNGEFSIIGIAKKRTNVLADHPDRGRSNAIEIPEGTDDPAPVTLALRGFGQITGKVTSKGAPAAGVTITDTPKGGGTQVQITQTADDGSFTITKAAEGPHVVSAMQGLGMSMKTTAANTVVTAGKTSMLAIDIPVGTITLTVAIKPLAGQKVDAAQVFLAHGTLDVGNAKALTDGFLSGAVTGMKFWFGEGKPLPAFEELVPGDYSVCTIPVAGDLSDPKLQQRLGEHVDQLHVYCKPVKITASPNAQTFVQEVPAMTPLPS